MKKIISLLVFCVMFVILCSCSSDNEKKASTTAEKFAKAYYNWKFSDCMEYVSDECKPYILYAAANTSEKDVEFLKTMEYGASVEVKSVSLTDEQNAVVEMLIENFAYSKFIDDSLQIIPEATATVKLKLQGNDWKVESFN